MQAEVKSEESKQRDTVKEQESRLGKLACCLPKAQNTIIPHRIILKYPHAFQAHLEKIADFLHCGEGIWWQHIMAGVEFLDGPDEKESQDDGPPLHHFRTHTLKSEEKYLKDCWKECITNEIPIPHPAVRIYDNEGNLQFIKYTGLLEDDDSTDHESSDEEVNEKTPCTKMTFLTFNKMMKNLTTFIISSNWENILLSMNKKKIWTRLVITKKTP